MDTPVQIAQASSSGRADPGFTLPDAQPAGESRVRTPAAASAPPAAGPAAGTNGQPAILQAPPEGAVQTDTSTRDLTLGGGIFLVLLIAFFFARGAYVNHLVAKRVSPSSAGSAGWLLFIGLSFASASLVLALINSQKYLSFWVTGPLLTVGLASLVGAVLVGRR